MALATGSSSSTKEGYVDPADITKGQPILWFYRDEVESGDVILVDKDRKLLTVIWLDGYKSRTDDVPFAEVIGVYSVQGQHVEIGNISGKTLFTAVGHAKFSSAHTATGEHHVVKTKEIVHDTATS